MDPMDYAFNHPSSSEAPYHIAVTSVSPPWIAYNSGPDEGNGAGPIYLPQTLTLPFPLPQDHLSFAHTYQHHSGQSSNLPWSSGLSHSSAPQDHALSRFRNLSSQSAEEGDQHIERTRGLRSWNSISTRHQLPRLESGTGNVTTLPNSVLRSAESESCSNDQTGIAPRDETLSSPASFFHDTPTFHPDRVLFRGQRWRSHNSNDEEALPDGVLPPLRSQAAFQSNNATPGAALPPLQQDLPSSLNSRQRSETSSRFPTARHSMSDAILPRIEAATNMPVPSSASLHSFTRTERPTSRPHRASRTQALDVQRPISVSLDLGSSSRLPSTGPSPGTSSGVASSSPRRQRPSRTGPRRHMAAPRSPSHAHDRHSIDRSLVREFLDSQDIGPADRIGNYTYPVIEEMMLRNLQALHGSMGHAKVARKSMVKALAHVPVEDLPEDERMCAICYGSYSIESPEGITEEAVQLPGCKHVFGAICLRTWLEDSDKCPYCRKKLPSEPKWFLSAAKRILNLIKRPQNTGCYAADPETCLTVFRGYDRGGASQSPPSMWRQPLDPGEPSSRALNSGRDSAAPGIGAALRNLTPSSHQQLPPSSRADRGHPSPLDR